MGDTDEFEESSERLSLNQNINIQVDLVRRK